jgi:glutathione-regulated potassium-efflux system ancillary protein KefC
MQEQGFLHQALVYLAAGVLVVPVFKRLGLGSVLGYLVAGAAIGPWGLALVSAPEAILRFAEFGVVLLLFLVGLELNPRRVWQLRKPIFGMGAAQVLATIAVVALAGWALGLEPRVALVAGMGFAMSSTAIGLASLQEKSLLATPGGQASFSVLLFQDLAVIPLLLLLGLISSDNNQNHFDWTATARAVGTIVAIIVGGRLLLRPVLRYVANTRQREIFVGFALMLVIGVAALMELVGLSTALGAFLGGVLLADSEYRHSLELDIEPFKGLLLGLFFIAVGMSVDLGLFVRAPLLVFAIAAGIVFVKALLLYPIAQTFGFCGRSDATLIAIALSQVGEFAFVLFGAAGRILPRETLDVLNAAVAASMLSTPFLLMLYERVLAPRFGRAEERAPDAIDEQNPVIIAGYGRFGQVVQRVLAGMKIRATVVDVDPNQIELVRRFGSKAYYGDATRLDLLESAGARKATLLVVAVDNAESAMQIVKLARRHFHHLKLVVRARSRSDAFEYHEMGVPALRETFGSALDASEASLRALDHGPLAARRVVARFRRHDEELLAAQAPHRNEVKRLLAVTLQGRQDLDQLLASEALPKT